MLINQQHLKCATRKLALVEKQINKTLNTTVFLIHKSSVPCYGIYMFTRVYLSTAIMRHIDKVSGIWFVFEAYMTLKQCEFYFRLKSASIEICSSKCQWI